MNSRIIMLLTFLLIVLSSCGTVNDEAVYDSKSETTVLVEKAFSTYLNDDDPINSRVATTRYNYYYDEKGNLISEVSKGAYVYDADGSLVSEPTYGALEIIYSYDDDNRLLLEADKINGLTDSYVYDESGNLVSKCEMDGFGTVTTSYSYNDNGYVSRTTEVYSLENALPGCASGYEDGDTSTTMYSYDDRGHITMESVVFKGLDGLEYSEIRKYSYDNTSGLLQEESCAYCGETAFSWTITYSYDISGNVLTATTVDHDGNVCYGHHTYTYDSVGNIIVDECRSVGGFEYSIKHRGVKADYLYYPEKSSKGVIERTYDLQGNILTQKNTTDVLDLIGYDCYSYDDDGNLISEENCCYDSDENLTQNRTVTEYEYATIVIEQ